MSAPALILVDFQQGFDDPAWGERNNHGAEEWAGALLSHWRSRERPVFIVRHDSLEAGSPLAPDAPGNALQPWAEPQQGERLIVKNVNSAFIGTTLEEELRRAGISRLVMAGITSDHCVSTSVRMAANLGFQVMLAEDATYTFARATPKGEILPAEVVHAAHMASLDGEFAEVLSCRAIVDRLAEEKV